MSGNYNFEYEMKFTDNPYIDLVVRDVKNMAINSVVKNERDALKYETLESRKASDELIRYMAGLPGTEKYIPETYNELNNYYRQLNGLEPYPSKEEIREWMRGRIPNSGYMSSDIYTQTLQELYESKYVAIEPYIQKGLQEGWLKPEDVSENGKLANVGAGKRYEYIHELQRDYKNSDEAKAALDFIDPNLDPKDNQAWAAYKYSTGKSEDSRTVVNMLDLMKADHEGPDFKYLYHLRDKAIDPYIARTAPDFTLLYCPKPTVQFGETNTEFPIYYKFLRAFDKNRQYVTSCVYSDAYAYGSEHYEDILIIFILIQTMIDLISETQEYIINKDIFDSRTIRYLFESYGIPYFKDIPIKYQMRLIKNVNTILKYKSSNKNIEDIKNIFDRKDIEIFTYWIIKVKKKDRDQLSFYMPSDVGQPVSPNSSHYVTEDMIGMEKYYENYDLAFLKIPISDQNCEKYIENDSLRRDYDDITLADPFWDGVGKDEVLSDREKENYHKRKKEDILLQDFSYERTKYIAVDAAINITKYSYQITYFMNMLFDALKRLNEGTEIKDENVTDLLVVDVDPMISRNKVRLNDLMSLMIALGYVYTGVAPDVIARDMEINMTINGFDFSTDWSQVYDSLMSRTRLPVIGPHGEIIESGTYQDNINLNVLDYLPKIDEDTYDDSFVCGRYEPDDDDPGSSIWQAMKETKIVDFFEGYYEATYHIEGQTFKKAYFKVGDPQSIAPDKAYPAYLRDAIEAGEYDAANIQQLEEDNNLWSHLIDLTWTPYTNNTHAHFRSIRELEDPNLSDVDRLELIQQIYYTNTKLKDHLCYMMKHAESKKEYDVYKIIYESYMETQFTKKFFTYRNSNNEYVIAETYEEWLQARNIDLADILRSAESYTDLDDRRTYINQVCDYVVQALEKYFDTDEWIYLYNLIPSYNQQFVRDWITKIILFFKSWKTQLVETSAAIDIDDNTNDGRYNSDNCVYVMDNMYTKSSYYPIDRLRPVTKTQIKSILSPREKVTVTDKVTMNRTYAYYQTGELDFMYDKPNNEYVRLIRYISPYDTIRLPETIEGLPCREIENTCFMNTTVNCDIPDCYTTIW